ncbi:MAG TPA: peptidoglycan-binding domain-containing protein [Stellaceae bacterium]
MPRRRRRCSDPVAAAQTALQRLGFLSAPADGAIGPQTRDAIIRFQAAQHLPIDPRVSDQLLSDLDRAAAPTAPGPETTGQPPLPAAPAGAPKVTGRQALPPGVTPPPIR